MRSSLSAVALAALLLAVPPAASPARSAAGRPVARFRVPTSDRDPAARSVRVYLPPSYDRPAARERRYPVVYLLHGWPGDDGNWPGEGRCAATLDSMIARGEIAETIAIMPDGRGGGLLGRSLWLDSADGRSRLDRFVARDLVAWADSNFRTRPDSSHRTVIGLSDGGTGAFLLLMGHPGIFSGAGSLSGRFRLRKELGMNARLIGAGAAADAFLAAHSPAGRSDREIAGLAGKRLYVDCGLDDGELADNREFHEKLVRLGVPHAYHEFPGGHGWGYWREHLRDALLALIGSDPGSLPRSP